MKFNLEHNSKEKPDIPNKANLKQVKEFRKIKKEVINTPGSGASNQLKPFQEKAREIWDNKFKNSEYIQRKIQIDLPRQLGILDETKNEIKEEARAEYAEFLNQLEEIFLSALDYYIKIFERGGKIDEEDDLGEFVEMCALDFYNTLLSLNRGDKNDLKNSTPKGNAQILRTVAKINPFQITMLKNLFGNELSWAQIKRSIRTSWGKYEKIKEILNERIRNIDELFAHFSQPENGGLARSQIQKFIFRQPPLEEPEVLKNSLEKCIKNIDRLFEYFSLPENGKLSKSFIVEFVFHQSAKTKFEVLKDSLEEKMAGLKKLLSAFPKDLISEPLIHKINLLIFKVPAPKREELVEKTITEIKASNYDQFELLLMRETQTDHIDENKLKTKICIELGISEITYLLYLTIKFNSIFGERKIQRLSSGGRDFGRSLQSNISHFVDRPYSEIVGKHDANFTKVENRSETRVISDYLITTLNGAVDHEELPEIVEKITDNGHGIESTQKAIRNISVYCKGEKEIWQVFSSVVKQDIEGVRRVLGNRFGEFFNSPEKEPYF